MRAFKLFVRGLDLEVTIKVKQCTSRLTQVISNFRLQIHLPPSKGKEFESKNSFKKMWSLIIGALINFAQGILLMKLSLDLKTESPKAWVDAVMADFNSFLQDHADCERKASAMALSFVAKYPDRKEIIDELIETG